MFWEKEKKIHDIKKENQIHKFHFDFLKFISSNA